LSRDYTATFSHIDNRGVARPSFLFHVMQDAATIHADELHFSAQALHILWVLSRIRVSLTRPIRPYETVCCQTWCPGVRGAGWYRRFTFAIQGQTIGEATSIWATLDPQTHRILRPGALPDASSFLCPMPQERLEPLPKFSCDTVRLHHEHRVLYSDLDINRHVNNARIADLIADTLDLQRQPGFLSTLQITYTMETTCGETLQLLRGRTSHNELYIRGASDGKTHFEAMAVLSPLPEQEAWP